jgi:hypothetical protein
MAGDLDAAVRRELIAALNGGNAHARFEDVVPRFSHRLQGETRGLPYSGWQLLEHIRLAQNDILRFSTNYDGSYKEMKFPDDYWPEFDAPPSEEAWEKSVQQFQRDLKEMQELVADTTHDLLAKLPHGSGQTLLREALLVADHNAYHVGQLILLRRALGIWPAK